MGRIIIAILLLVSLVSLYLFDSLQNDEIQKHTLELKNKKEHLIKIDSVISLKQKITSMGISFDTKDIAEKKLMEKIDFYKNQLKLQFNSNIIDKNNYFFVKAHKSIENNYSSMNGFLNKLKKDDFLIINQIRTHKNKILLEIQIQYPYIEKNGDTNIDYFFQKSQELDNKLKNTVLQFQDISFNIDEKQQQEDMQAQEDNVLKEVKKEYALQLILIGEQKKAIINGKIVNIDDYIEKAKILDIQKDRVLLKEGNSQRWLKVLK